MIRAAALRMDDGSVQAATTGPGDAGSVELKVGTLDMSNGAGLAVITLGEGRGGQLTVHADGEIRVHGHGSDDGVTRLAATAFAAGEGGRMLVVADRLVLSEDAAVQTGATGGDLYVEVGRMVLRDGAQLRAESIGSSLYDGSAGNLTVIATEAIEIAGEVGGRRSEIRDGRRSRRYPGHRREHRDHGCH